MIKLRLKRYGKKREASYRIVAANSKSRRDGRPLEELGFYNPRTDETRLNVPAIEKRLKEGAQPTDTVRDILRKANILESNRPGVPTPSAAVSDVVESSESNVESGEIQSEAATEVPAESGPAVSDVVESSEANADTEPEAATDTESSEAPTDTETSEVPGDTDSDRPTDSGDTEEPDRSDTEPGGVS